MSDKRMLIIDVELLRKIDENRGDMSRSEFINYVIDSLLGDNIEVKQQANYITKEEFSQFEEGIKQLLRNFLEFFISYGVELGNEPKEAVFEELTKKLKYFEKKGKTKPPN